MAKDTKKSAKVTVINIFGLDVLPQTEAAYNKWYNEVHCPMVMESEDLKKVTRYERIGDDAKYPKYVTINEFEDQEAYDKWAKSEALAKATAEARKTWAEQGGGSLKWRMQYKLIKSWER